MLQVFLHKVFHEANATYLIEILEDEIENNNNNKKNSVKNLEYCLTYKTNQLLNINRNMSTLVTVATSPNLS